MEKDEYIIISKGWGSSVDIATGYGLDDQGLGGLIPDGGWVFFSSPCPDRLWGPSSL
jgi:hypothetical protein